MQFNFNRHKCKLCDSFISKNKRSLSYHIKRMHTYTLQMYVDEFYYFGSTPTCDCGCREKTSWHPNQLKYTEYKQGHNPSGFTTENQPTFTSEQIKNRGLAIAEGHRKKNMKNNVSKKVQQILDDTFKKMNDPDYIFPHNRHPLICRNDLIAINDPTLGGPGKDFTRDKLKPALIKFFQEYVRTYGFFEHETKDTLGTVITKLRNKEIDTTSEWISSLTRDGNDYLKSIFSSYWNVDKGPAKLWFNDHKFGKVLDYRLGLNNSKDYSYTLDDGSRWAGRETFDISPHTLIRGFVVQRATVSWFKPSVAYHIYKRFCNEIENPVVWDPSMGFGARLTGFVAACPSGKYIGTDPASETFLDLKVLEQEIINSKVFDGGMELHKNGSEMIQLNENIGDLVFTSPPYFDLERYYDEPGQCWRDHNTLELWIENYLIPTFENAYKFLKQDGHLVINVSKKYGDIIAAAAKKVGFRHIETFKLKTGRDHFNKKAGHHKTNFEPIFVFKKRSPNARR